MLLVPTAVICAVSVAQQINMKNFIIFCTFGKKLAATFHNNCTSFSKLFEKAHNFIFFVEHPAVNQIVELICSFNVNKAVGHNNISAFFLKSAPFVIANYLFVFAKFSSENGFFPDACKIAKIVAIHKNGDKSHSSNYRPISILTCFSKNFEGLLHK